MKTLAERLLAAIDEYIQEQVTAAVAQAMKSSPKPAPVVRHSKETGWPAVCRACGNSFTKKAKNTAYCYDQSCIDKRLAKSAPRVSFKPEDEVRRSEAQQFRRAIERSSRTCLNCGKDTLKLYCSDDCRREHEKPLLRSSPEGVRCAFCNEPFEPATKRSRFCCRSCYFRARVRQARPDEGGKGGQAECEQCGNTFTKKRIDSKHCSAECQRIDYYGTAVPTDPAAYDPEWDEERAEAWRKEAREKLGKLNERALVIHEQPPKPGPPQWREVPQVERPRLQLPSGGIMLH